MIALCYGRVTCGQAYPSIGSLAKVYGAITFVLAHPSEVDAYLKDQDRVFEDIKARYPLPQDMVDRFERARKEAAANSLENPLSGRC